MELQGRGKAGRRPLAVLGAGMAMALALTGCSSVPDWANPVSWYDSVVSDSKPASASKPEARPATNSSRPQTETGTPNLASVPNRPTPSTDSGERRTIESGLVADREHARYTDEDVRAQPSSAPTLPRPVQAAAPPPASKPATPSGGVPAAAPRAPVVAAAAAPPPPPPAPAPAPAAAAPAPAPVPTAAPPPTRTAQAAPAPAPAPTPMSAPPPAPAPVPPGSTALVQQTYEQALRASAATVTTATTGMGMAAAPAPAPAPTAAPPATPPSAAGGAGYTPSTPAAAGAPSRLPVGPQKAVVFFPSGSAALDTSDRRELRRIANQYKLSGGRVRVVGHASSRTKDLPLERHKWVNFSLSMQRAEAVARELMRLGVSPGAVQVEARSDSEPVFSEAMPSAEKQNRRAEIFLEN